MFYAFLLLLDSGLVASSPVRPFLFYAFWNLSCPHVFPDRHLGPRPSNLCRVKFPVHHGGSVLMLVAIVYLYLRVGAEVSTTPRS